MTAYFNAFENKLVDAIYRGQAITMPATMFVGLIVATKGVAAISTAYSSGDTVVPATSNGRIYKCTTAGTSASSPPTFPTTNGATVSDGSVVWTEQTLAIKAGTFTECSGTGYARVSAAPSLANWAGTQGAGTTVASTGTSAQTSNNGAITFGAPTSTWGVVAAAFTADAVSGGNNISPLTMAQYKTINNGDAAPSFAAGTLTITIDN